MLRVWLRLLPILMLFLTESGGAGGGDGDGGAGSEDANAGGKQGGKSQGEGDKPFAQFPDADSFNARMDREAKSRLAKLATDAGFESLEAMQAAAKAKAEADDQAKSDADKAKERADKAEAESKSALERANARVVQAEARVVASDLGIKGERIGHAIKLADLSEIAVSDAGEPDGTAIKAALDTVLKDIPELKATDPAPKGGAEFNGGAGEGGERKSLRDAVKAHYERT